MFILFGNINSQLCENQKRLKSPWIKNNIVFAPKKKKVTLF